MRLDSSPTLVISDLEDEQAYEVQLEAFTGPMDLLLHLIRKQKVNIYDIPIALLVRQYLEYLSLMKTLNLSMAGDFLVMASTLLYIKSRMLLPKEVVPESEDEDVLDPRSELVRQLVEYERFKEAAGTLVSRERQWQDSFSRDPLPVLKKSKEKEEEEVWEDDLQLFDLLSALQNVLDRSPSDQYIELSKENWTVEERIQVIMERLESEATLPFEALFEEQGSRALIIVTFLGLLELVRMNLIQLFQGEWFGPIHVTRRFVPAPEAGASGVSLPEEL